MHFSLTPLRRNPRVVKLIALYKKPSDPSSFDRHYRDTHVPLVRKWPGLRRVELGRVTAMPGAGVPPHYLIAEKYFDDQEAMRRALRSPESQATAENLQPFAPGLVSP